MAKLICFNIQSVDGYIEDAEGGFGWAKPDAEAHALANDVERGTGTHLLGRRMWETMRVWDDVDPAGQEPLIAQFAELWKESDKVVYSRTLESLTAPRTTLEHEFDPEAVRALKAGADRDLSVGGADLAAQALSAGLVDEVHLIVVPAIVGGGKQALSGEARLDLELLDERRLGSRNIYLRYGVA